MRIYPDAQYLPLTADRLLDALHVAEQCFAEHDGDISLQGELSSVREAVANWKSLGMKSGVLYADGELAAMIIFSALSEQCIDAHFEKATNKFAQDGAFVALNKFMASSEEISAYKYINREEDMDIDGLRRAKEAYHPIFKTKKYYGEVPT